MGKGRSIDVDFSKSFEWFDKAAQQNQIYALYWLGWLHQRGFGCVQNQEKAEEYFRKCIEIIMKSDDHNRD